MAETSTTASAGSQTANQLAAAPHAAAAQPLPEDIDQHVAAVSEPIVVTIVDANVSVRITTITTPPMP